MSETKENRRSETAKGRTSVGAALLILVAVLSLSIGGVVAYLSTQTGAVENTFTNDAPEKPTVVEDAFTGSTKSNVKVDVGNPGYAVYVRAAVVVTWKDAAGNVMGQAPVPGADGDYTIIYNTTDWVLGSDGFYYHKAMVNSGADTAVLIRSCTPNAGKTPKGYGLHVEIIAQTVQALGGTDNDNTPAVEYAWGVNIVDGKIQ